MLEMAKILNYSVMDFFADEEDLEPQENAHDEDERTTFSECTVPCLEGRSTSSCQWYMSSRIVTS